ncbi:MAG: PRC-barrel domain-containing protein [Bacteroidota bacterium]
MFRLELKEGTAVSTFDGIAVGKLTRLILDPSTNDLTHIVVGEGAAEKVVPANMIRTVSEDKIVLGDEVDGIDQLPPFDERHFIQVTNEDGLNAVRQSGDYPTYHHDAHAYYWYPSLGSTDLPAYGLTSEVWPRQGDQENIPGDGLPVKEGAKVISSDRKHVGEVERMFLQATSNRVTYFVIKEGVFFKERKLVPANWIVSITDDAVQLSVRAELLEQLPPFEA